MWASRRLTGRAKVTSTTRVTGVSMQFSTRSLRGSHSAYARSAAAAGRQSAFDRSVRYAVESLEARRLLAAIVVTGTGDDIAVDGVVTLREAITSANNNANVNADVVPAG